MTHRRRRPSPEGERIRELFLDRQESYEPGALARLLGISGATVREAIADGRITAIPAGGEVRIMWQDVVALGLEQRWTLRMLTEALRGADAAALPPPIRVVPHRVLLPQYQWDVLRLLAAQRARDERREITVSDLLEEATAALLAAIDDWEAWETSLPGLRAAAAWPAAEQE